MSRSAGRAATSAPIRLARGSAALVVLTGLVVGVPWALVHFVGMPLPSALPSPDGLRRSIEQTGVGEGAVIKAVAVVVWVAWSRLAASVLVDLAASLSRRPVPRLAMLGSTQRIVGGMVASVMLMFGVVRPGAVMAGPVTRPAAPVVAGARVMGLAAPSRSGTAPASIVIGSLPVPVGALLTTEPDGGGRFERESPAGETPSTATWTVRRNDSFWRIAEQSLGDGRRWPEVVRANVGREVAPGLVFTEQTEAIHPGWVLALPPAVAVGAAGVQQPSMVEVRPGDSLGSIAEAVYGADTEWTTVWEANRERHFGDRVFDDPNLILPGWQLLIPDDPSPVEAQPDPEARRINGVRDVLAVVGCTPDPVPSPESQRPSAGKATVGPAPTGELDGASSTSMPAASAGAASVTPPPPATRPTESAVHGASQGISAPIGLAGAGLLATGALGLLTARRRAALRGSHAGDRLAALAPPLIRLEREIRLVADAERLARLDLAVRVAHHHLIAGPVAPGRLIGAIVHPCGTVELCLASDAPSPSQPFVVGPGDRWTLPAEVALESIGADIGFGAFPCPALTQLGRYGTSDVYLDLEAVGLLVIEGPAPVCAAILRALALSISLSPFAEQARLITCGVAIPRLDGGIATSSVESADVAIDLAAELLSGVLGALRPGRTTAELRHRSAGEAWEPAVVVIGASLLDPGVAGGLADDLPSLCSPPGRGLAVVTDARLAAPSRLTAGDGGWLLSPLDLVIHPIGLSGPVGETLVELLSPAVHVVERPAPAPNRLSELAVGEPITVRTTPFVEADWALMLRTLGPVDLVDRAGRAAPFGRSKALELVAWLVDHRHTATRRGARAALWESEVQDATFANVVSDARRTMARLCMPPDGEEWIARSLDERLAIHGRLVSDVEVLRARIAHARVEPRREAIATLRSGLEMVRDAPFVASDYLWPDAEGTTSQVMLTVTEAATMMAEHCLALGDPVGVFWATGKGMLAVPGHEELISLRMRAHASTGDLAGVRAEWASYERVLHADRWSAAEPAPKLLELRRDLLGPRQAA